eukprot:scaffold38006_cov18-Tisochrysis_lutea.AAC.2
MKHSLVHAWCITPWRDRHRQTAGAWRHYTSDVNKWSRMQVWANGTGWDRLQEPGNTIPQILDKWDPQ